MQDAGWVVQARANDKVLSDRDRTLEQLLYAIEHDNRAGF
jgi:hypothetical protein